jgi:hypothetical protein
LKYARLLRYIIDQNDSCLFYSSSSSSLNSGIQSQNSGNLQDASLFTISSWALYNQQQALEAQKKEQSQQEQQQEQHVVRTSSSSHRQTGKKIVDEFTEPSSAASLAFVASLSFSTPSLSSIPALLQFAYNLTKSETTDEENRYYIRNTTLPSFLSVVIPQKVEMIAFLSKSLIVERLFSSLLLKMFEAFSFLLGDSSPLVRARAVKSLSSFLRSSNEGVEPEGKESSSNTGGVILFSLAGSASSSSSASASSLLSLIQGNILHILEDPNRSVREEGVKLIGPFILQSYSHSSSSSASAFNSSSNSSSSLANALLMKLKFLLYDEGISVRRAVVNIIKEILTNQPLHSQYIDLCLRLLERLSYPKEEESIKEIICNLFTSLWFSPPKNETIERMRNIFRKAEQEGKSSSSSSFVKEEKETAAASQNETKMDIDNEEEEDESVLKNPLYQLALLSRSLSKSTSSSSSSAKSPSHHNRGSKGDYSEYYCEFTALQLLEIIRSSLSHPSSAAATVSSSSDNDSSPCHEWILTLLQSVLHGKSLTGNEQSSSSSATVISRRQLAYDHCYKIVSFMVSLLLTLEEASSHEIITKFLLSSSASSDDSAVNALAEYKTIIISTIALFCEAHPPFLSKHLLTFLPYLKGDSSLPDLLRLKVCGYIMKILESIALLEKSNLRYINLTSIIDEDLSDIPFKQTGKNISLSISCIATLVACVTKDKTPLVKLLQKCLFFLHNVFDNVYNNIPTSGGDGGGGKKEEELANIELPPNYSAIVQRCLVILGYLCEHSKKCRAVLQEIDESEEERNDSEEKGGKNKKKKENSNSNTGKESSLQKAEMFATINKLASTSFPLIPNDALNSKTFYGIAYSAIRFSLLFKKESAIQLRAIQALCGVFSGFPRLILLDQSLIEDILSSSFFPNPLIQERFIIGIKDIMVAEEAMLEKKSAIQAMNDSKIVNISSSIIRDAVLSPLDHDYDVTIVGRLFQQYLKKFFSFLHNSNSSPLRFFTLQLLATLLRQGLIVPIDVLPMIIMLLGDEVEEIKSTALHLLILYDEKNADFLDSRLLEGITLTYDFQRITFHGRIQPYLLLSSTSSSGHLQQQSTEGMLKQSIFSSLYSTCIAVSSSSTSKVSNKRKFLLITGLLRKTITILTVDIDQAIAGGLVSSMSPTTTTMQGVAVVPGTPTKTGQMGVVSYSSPSSSNILRISPPFLPSRKTSLTPSKRASLLSSSSSESSFSLAKINEKNLFSSLQALLSRYGKVKFLLATLSSLPYNYLDEIMCIIHWISRNIIQTECSLVLKKLEYLLSFFGGFLGSSDNNNGGNDKKGGGVDEEEGEEDEDESKKKKKTDSYNPFDNEMKLNLKKEKEIFSSLTSSSSAASTSTSASSSAHQLFYQLVAYQCQLRAEELLIRLKSYLKEEYALTDEMCKDYESNPERSTSSATYDQRETDFSLSLKDVLDIEMLYSEEHLKLLLGNKQISGLSSVSLSSTGTGNSKKKKGGSSAVNDNTIDSSVVTISKEEIFHSLLSQCVYDFNRVTALLEKEGDDFKLESQFGLSVANKRKKRATSAKKVVTESRDVSGS